LGDDATAAVVGGTDEIVPKPTQRGKRALANNDRAGRLQSHLRSS
jgi:hypothetical protein